MKLLLEAISDAPFQIFDLTLSEMVSISIFLLAWRHQQICTRILAELRKNSKGTLSNVIQEKSY